MKINWFHHCIPSNCGECPYRYQIKNSGNYKWKCMLESKINAFIDNNINYTNSRPIWCQFNRNI